MSGLFSQACAAGLRERLAAHQVVFGTWVMGSRDPAVVRMIASIGYDFVLLDRQHVPLGDEVLVSMCEVAAACGIPALVRLAEVSRSMVNHVLDLGASGIVCPDVRDRAAVDEARSGMLFPPRGRRSAMGVSPGLVFHTPSSADDLAALEEGAILVGQIESREAVTNLGAIVGGGGVDVLDVGRGDLAIDCGEAGLPTGPVTAAALAEVVRLARELAIPVGSTCNSIRDAATLLELGVTCLTYSSDRRLLSAGWRVGLDDLRALTR